jgi:hypothetical protein
MTVRDESAISDTSLSRVDLLESEFVSREFCVRSVFVGTDRMAAFVFAVCVWEHWLTRTGDGTTVTIATR